MNFGQIREKFEEVLFAKISIREKLKTVDSQKKKNRKISQNGLFVKISIYGNSQHSRFAEVDPREKL